MIIDLILKYVAVMLHSFNAALPVWTLDITTSPFMVLLRYMWSLDALLPIDTAILPILGYRVIFVNFHILRKIVMVVINLVRGSGIS